jgi:hypothetical protein
MFAKERILFNEWSKATIMLDKVCAYACNYAHDGVVYQYFWQWSSLSFKAHWNERSTCELTRLMYVFIDIKLLDRGIGRKILVVAHDTKLWLINFFDRTSTKCSTFF